MDLDVLLDDLKDLECPELSWRTAKLSDWKLHVGETTYNIHTAVLGDGPRRSELLHAQFARWRDGNAQTSLGEILPDLCLPVIEIVLDFAYGGEIELTATAAVRVFKVAHVLQMRQLAQEAISYLKVSIQVPDNSRVILADALQLQPGLDALVASAKAIVAANLDSFEGADLAPFPYEVLTQILASEWRKATPRSVSHLVAAHLRASSTLESFQSLSSFTDEPHAEDAVYLLGQSLLYKDTTSFRTKCLDTIAKEFHSVCIRDLSAIPLETMIELFDSDLLNCPEDGIFDAVVQYATAAQLDADQHQELWATCRFAFLTPKKVARAVDVKEIPPFWFKLGLAASLHRAVDGPRASEEFVASRGEGGPSRQLQLRRLNPRKTWANFWARFKEELSGTKKVDRFQTDGFQGGVNTNFVGNLSGTFNIVTVSSGCLAITIEIGTGGDNDQYFGVLTEPAAANAPYKLLQDRGYCVREARAPIAAQKEITGQPWQLKGCFVTMLLDAEEGKVVFWSGTCEVEMDLERGHQGGSLTLAVGLFNNSAKVAGIVVPNVTCGLPKRL